MLAFWDKDLVCRFANSSYVKWFGRTPEEMIDKITLPELLGNLYQKNLPYITGALRGELQVFERDICMTSGETRTTIATYKPEISNNQVTGFYVHVADISPLKNPFDTRISKQKLRESASSDQLLSKAEHILRSSLFTSFPGIKDLSNQLFISPTKLKRDFKKRYGSTLFSYYRTLQMQIAYSYLHEKIYTKKQVADMLGFENHSNFSACYKKYLAKKSKLKDDKQVLPVAETSNDTLNKTFIQKAPYSVAMLDKNFKVIVSSAMWNENEIVKKHFTTGKDNKGAFLHLISEWEKVLITCPEDGVRKGEELIFSDSGKRTWIRWTIRSLWKAAE
jgi:AraC-like DNA-binding protein